MLQPRLSSMIGIGPRFDAATFIPIRPASMSPTAFLVPRVRGNVRIVLDLGERVWGGVR